MSRHILADGLQARLDAVPLYPHHIDPPVVKGPRTRRERVAVAVMAILMIGPMIAALAYALGNGAWWRTESTMTCTVNDYVYHDTYGAKTGPGVVYDVDTSCGPLQVTSGMILHLDDATALGDSLRAGQSYKLDVRGWKGWPNVTRAIVSAEPVSLR